MKVAILAGGLGSRLLEETATRPKPLVQIGDMPILWHIMKHYSHFAFNEFVVALGYKGDQLKRFLVDHLTLSGSIRVDGITGEITQMDEKRADDWVVDLVETGELTGAGGRLRRLAPYLGSETFMLTYCDGVADVNLEELLEFHRSHGRLATLTAVRPQSRFGVLGLGPDGRSVTSFAEKPQESSGWINGGYFVLEPRALDYIEGDHSDWGGEPLARLAAAGELMAYQHNSFWQCMDTLQEKQLLDDLWRRGQAPWKIWA